VFYATSYAGLNLQYVPMQSPWMLVCIMKVRVTNGSSQMSHLLDTVPSASCLDNNQARDSRIGAPVDLKYFNGSSS
jgi:hypothetical protein